MSGVTICSNALQMLGAKPINDFNEKTEHARLAKSLYPSVRDDILRGHPWNCATKRVILAPLATAPAFDFTYQFPLPGDWLRTLQVGKKGQQDEYRSEGRNILANVTTLHLVYIFRNEDESSWSTNLIELAELQMAAKMAYAVTKSSSIRDSFRDEFARAFKVSKAIDGQDDPPEEFSEGTLLEARFQTR